MRKVKIAQIGTSLYSHGSDIFRSLTKQKDVFEVIGYALPENEREKFPSRMGVFAGYREMSVEEILNDPEIEAVTVETEEIYLTKYAQMVADHGKHIHMEKPGGTSLVGFEKLVETLRKNEKVFHTGYMYRYNPYVKELMKKVKEGELGEIISVEAQMNSCSPVINRRWLEHFPGGMMFFLGCHLVDFVLQIKGIPEKIVPLNCCTGNHGVTVKDFGMALLQYKSGTSFVKTTADEYGGFARRQLVVVGTKGTVEIKPLEMHAPGGLYTEMRACKASDSWTAMGEITKSEIYDRYDNMMAGFASYVRGDKENPWGYDYELLLYKTLLKCCGGELDETDK